MLRVTSGTAFFPTTVETGKIHQMGISPCVLYQATNTSPNFCFVFFSVERRLCDEALDKDDFMSPHPKFVLKNATRYQTKSCTSLISNYLKKNENKTGLLYASGSQTEL